MRPRALPAAHAAPAARLLLLALVFAGQCLVCVRALQEPASPLLTLLTDRRLCCSGVRRQPRRQAALRRPAQQLQQVGTARAQR